MLLNVVNWMRLRIEVILSHIMKPLEFLLIFIIAAQLVIFVDDGV